MPCAGECRVLPAWRPNRTDDGRLVLRFQDGSFKDPFIARYVSDGTIKMFAYLVLLYDPNPHSLLAIEEPENQLDYGASCKNWPKSFGPTQSVAGRYLFRRIPRNS